MLKIRLQRIGKRGQAYFRVVILEHTKKPKGEFLGLLGNYDPHKKEFKVDMEKVNHWVSKGAQVSPTVNNLLVNYKYWDKLKVQSWKPKKIPEASDKRQETSSKGQGTKNGSTSVTTKEQKVEILAEASAELQPETQPAA